MSARGPVISLITVNYNGGEVFNKAIRNWLDIVGHTAEIVVYDNASKDDSIDRLPADDRLLVLRGTQNLGFAAGNNRAASHARGEWLHFINPDIFVSPSLRESYKSMQSTDKQILWVHRLSNEDGTPQHMGMLIPTLSNYIKRLVHPSGAHYWYIGASMAMHKDVFKELGGWSEDYFMYSEDLDLCYTAHKKGVPIRLSETVLTHIGKVSSNTAWSTQERAHVIEKSLRTFYRKHRNMLEYALIRCMQFAYQLLKDPQALGPGIRAFFKKSQ